MELSILIATLPKNLTYLEKCIEYIKKHSAYEYEHQILVYLNGTNPMAESLLTTHNIQYRANETNIGVAGAINSVAELVEKDYICHLNDDMLVLPGWDIELNHVRESHFLSIEHFYLTPRVIEPNVPFHVPHCALGNYGDSLETFKEQELLNEYKRFRTCLRYSQTMPWIVKKSTFNTVEGYSKEFPIHGSDHDFMMKIYELTKDHKYFVCAGKSLVYHFGSKSK